MKIRSSIIGLIVLALPIISNAQSVGAPNASPAEAAGLSPNVPDGTLANVEQIALLQPFAIDGFDVCMIVAPKDMDLAAAMGYKAPGYGQATDVKLISAYMHHLGGDDGLHNQLEQYAKEHQLGDWTAVHHMFISRLTASAAQNTTAPASAPPSGSS